MTKSQKATIIAEEKFRAEVRQQLSTPKPEAPVPKKGSAILGFFNSALGLWLLSAIFLTGGIQFYNSYKSGKDDLKNSTESIERLDLEIGFRISHVIEALAEQDSIKADTAAVRKIFYSLGSNVTAPAFLYQDYKSFNTVSLLAEERRILAHEQKLDSEVDRVMSHLAELTGFAQVRKLKFSAPKEIAGAIQKELWIDRWRGASWYYTEGSQKNPFP